MLRKSVQSREIASFGGFEFLHGSLVRLVDEEVIVVQIVLKNLGTCKEGHFHFLVKKGGSAEKGQGFKSLAECFLVEMLYMPHLGLTAFRNMYFMGIQFDSLNFENSKVEST